MSDAQVDAVAPDVSGDAVEAPDKEADLTAELEKWKAQARKHEDRAKANAAAAKELEKLREQSMSDQERAVEEARRAARREALAEVGASRVDDAVRVAASGRAVDVDALLEGLDRSRFLGEDGVPDRDAVAAWVDRVAPKPAEQGSLARFEVVNLGQGQDSVPALNSSQLERDLRNVLGIR